MNFSKKQQTKINEETTKQIKQKLTSILGSGILDDPKRILEEVNAQYDFTRKLAEIVFNIAILMNETKMFSPSYNFVPENKTQWMFHFSVDMGKDLYIFPATIDTFTGGESEFTPAYVSNGFSAIEDQEAAFQYIQGSFTTIEKILLFQAILDWFDVNIISPKTDINDSILASIKAFYDKIKNLIGKISVN